MQPNVNPETGVRYGIISANSLNPDVIHEIQSYGRDLYFEAACDDIRREVGCEDLSADEAEQEIERRIESLGYSWYHDEPVHAHVMDGVTCQTTWLGGALLVWIFESPKRTKAKLCSPCVPNCGDLDNVSEDGVECYDVPDDWRYTHE